MSQSYFNVEAASNTAMKLMLQSPAHYKTWEEQRRHELPGDGLRFGTALHTLILEPHNTHSISIWIDTKTLTSKAAEEARWTNPHLTYVTADEWQTLMAMRDALFGNEKLKKMIDACQKEVEIYGQEETTFGAVPAKAMLDGVCDRFIIDLKSTRDFATDFVYTAKRYKYKMQAAWYRHMAFNHLSQKHRDFYFIVIEKNPPHGIVVYRMSEDSFMEGEADFMRGLDLYAYCKTTGIYECYNSNLIETL